MWTCSYIETLHFAIILLMHIDVGVRHFRHWWVDIVHALHLRTHVGWDSESAMSTADRLAV